MISNLPVPPMDTRNENDSQLVDDILKGMGDQNIMYNRQMDGEVVVPQENTLQPTPEQITQMQQQYYEPQPQYVIPQMSYEPVKQSFSIFNFLKSTVLFFFIFLLLSAPFVKNLMLKIAFFNIEGELSLVGLLLKALVGGLVFSGVNLFL